MMRRVLAAPQTYAVILIAAAIATWVVGQWPALQGALLAIVTAGVLIAGWLLLGRAMSRTAQDEARQNRGGLLAVLAFLLKVPAIGLAAVVANRIAPPGPTSFAAWIVLVYSGAVVWGVCRKSSH